MILATFPKNHLCDDGQEIYTKCQGVMIRFLGRKRTRVNTELYKHCEECGECAIMKLDREYEAKFNKNKGE